MSDINNIKAGSAVSLTTASTLNSRNNNEQTQSTENSTSPVGSDKVSLTETALQIQSVKQTLADAPAVSSERVSELKAAIAEGSYKVDATELAGNIIDFESKIR